MEPFFLIALVVLAIPFVLPIVAWVSARGTRKRMEMLVSAIERQRDEIDLLRSRLNALELQPEARREPAAPPRAAPPVPGEPARPVVPPVAAREADRSTGPAREACRARGPCRSAG